MNIYAKNGDKVKYTGCDDTQVNYGGHDDPRGILIEGQIYEVDYTDVDRWKTDVYLKNIKGGFNSVCFEDVIEFNNTEVFFHRLLSGKQLKGTLKHTDGDTAVMDVDGKEECHLISNIFIKLEDYLRAIQKNN